MKMEELHKMRQVYLLSEAFLRQDLGGVVEVLQVPEDVITAVESFPELLEILSVRIADLLREADVINDKYGER